MICRACKQDWPEEDFYLQGGIHKGSGRRDTICKKCFNRRCMERRYGTTEAKEKHKLIVSAWKHANKEKVAKKQRQYIERYKGSISDTYIMARLRKDNGFQIGEDIPPELIELKRMQVQIYREINNQTQIQK